MGFLRKPKLKGTTVAGRRRAASPLPTNRKAEKRDELGTGAVSSSSNSQSLLRSKQEQANRGSTTNSDESFSSVGVGASTSNGESEKPPGSP